MAVPGKKYPSRSRAAVRREAAKRANRLPRQFTQSAKSRPIAPAIDINAEHQCDHRGCHRPRYLLWRYCRDHAKTYKATGHPVALDVRRYEWRPFVLQAEAFVRAQLIADHPSILAGIRWCVDEIARAKKPTNHDPAFLRYAEHLLRVHRHGVDAPALLARPIAAYLSDDRDWAVGPRFASDEHFAHQLARLWLAPKPFGSGRATWGGKRTRIEQPTIKTSNLLFSTRAFAYERVNAALGLLALHAATEIRRRQDEEARTSSP